MQRNTHSIISISLKIMCVYTYACVNYKENPPEFYLNVISWWGCLLYACFLIFLQWVCIICVIRDNNNYYYYYDDDYKKSKANLIDENHPDCWGFVNPNHNSTSSCFQSCSFLFPFIGGHWLYQGSPRPPAYNPTHRYGLLQQKDTKQSQKREEWSKAQGKPGTCFQTPAESQKTCLIPPERGCDNSCEMYSTREAH